MESSFGRSRNCFMYSHAVSSTGIIELSFQSQFCPASEVNVATKCVSNLTSGPECNMTCDVGVSPCSFLPNFRTVASISRCTFLVFLLLYPCSSHTTWHFCSKPKDATTSTVVVLAEQL